VPNAACVDASRGRLFVVNKGSSFITEYRTSDLSPVRNIAWVGTDTSPADSHFEIVCAPDRLYVVDGAWMPGLYTVSDLDGSSPVASPNWIIMGVGALTRNSANTSFYYWYQHGWSAGNFNTSVHRNSTASLSEADASSTSIPNFHRNPLDAPILLDETRNLVFAKNKVFNALDLTQVVYTLPSYFDAFDGATENAYALDPRRGLLSTKEYVYELDRYEVVEPTLNPDADQLFFDARGRLWFLSLSRSVLDAQVVRR
jgi:hypothetical protein